MQFFGAGFDVGATSGFTGLPAHYGVAASQMMQNPAAAAPAAATTPGYDAASAESLLSQYAAAGAAAAASVAGGGAMPSAFAGMDLTTLSSLVQQMSSQVSQQSVFPNLSAAQGGAPQIQAASAFSADTSQYPKVGHFPGIVQEFDEAKGFGFVYCEELALKRPEVSTRKTIFFLRSQLNNCKIGDLVTFDIVLDNYKRPMAQNLMYVRDGIPIDLKEQKKEKANAQKGADLGEFVGVIAIIADEKGLQRIRSEELLAQGWVWDAVIDLNEGMAFELNMGDKVAFTAFETYNGRLRAKNVKLVESSFLGKFEGDVKSYNEKTGYGFIASDDVRDLGHQDVFVHTRFGNCPSLSLGDRVSFECFLSLKKQPQAKNVIVLEKGENRPPPAAKPLSLEGQEMAKCLKRSMANLGGPSPGGGQWNTGQWQTGTSKGTGRKVELPAGIALLMKMKKQKTEDNGAA